MENISEIINKRIKKMKEDGCYSEYMKEWFIRIQNCIKDHPERIVSKCNDKELSCICGGKRFFKTGLTTEDWTEEFGRSFSGHSFICLNCLEHYYNEIYGSFYDI